MEQLSCVASSIFDELRATSPAQKWTTWDTFLATTTHAGFMQSSAWADFRLTLGYPHFAALIKSRGRIVGGGLVQKCWFSSDRCFYYIQDGPVLPGEGVIAGDVFGAILDEIEHQRREEQATVSHVRIEPRWEVLPEFVSGFQEPCLYDRFIEPRRTVCVDLQPPEEVILARMKPKGRYNIRLAQRHGVSVVEDTSAQGLSDFQSMYEDMAERQLIEAKAPEFFETLVAIFAEQNKVDLFFAEHNGSRLAGALVLYFGQRATYFFGASLDIHRNVMAPYLLHFEIMRRAKARGVKEYDLWGVAPDNKPDDPWQDISVFKRKFGGREVELVPSLDHVYDHEAYDEFVATESSSEEVSEDEDALLEIGDGSSTESVTN